MVETEENHSKAPHDEQYQTSCSSHLKENEMVDIGIFCGVKFLDLFLIHLYMINYLPNLNLLKVGVESCHTVEFQLIPEDNKTKKQ